MQRSLGRAIRKHRGELGLTQEELAERVAMLGDDSIRQSDISRLEQGQVQMPRLQRLEKLAEALETSLGSLLIDAGWLDEEQVRATVEALDDEAGHDQPQLDPEQAYEVRKQAIRGATQRMIDVLGDREARGKSFEQRRAEFRELVEQFEHIRAEFERERGKRGPNLRA